VAATPTRGGGSTPYDTGFVDLAGSQGLLGQREGRTSKTVIDWLRERTPEFRDAIEFVAIDPAAVYANAVRTEGLLPNARLVVDHFHLVKLANDSVTKVRRRVIWEQQGGVDVRSTRRGRTAADCSQRRNACQQRDSPKCGMTSSTPIRRGRS
jgi:transposase